ncbi:LLM class flavin-dependent oxidoreductase [Paenibacillus sp. MMS18-CY102]|uniref:LLM class flavin-dependent oxidoreductase n=1 Tax=Paenibacillus sp. MMS18-CY102 TaxID=2682849 RepID=UPI0013657955|nr:LLM class flavin-dependent oxidoreductase [Paenibacillus sp. MMS18-CY102]MWC27034.1 MsnO8 family LLM class oxidoreductase [Paenibacillus sp. MMS18-CY102]
MTAVRLSILDQSPIYEGETGVEALQRTVELAQCAEKLGYARFWVSEHHDSNQVAGSSPEVLISYLLARTSTIRIGSGGVMLQHYSPYKVAENFNVLASLAPGRVDLGIGRAPGGLPRSTRALQQTGGGDSGPRDLGDKVKELAKFLNNTLEEGHPLAGLRAAPIVANPAALYLLGASVASAQIAAELAYPYVFSLFINNDEAIAKEALDTYRANFDRSQGVEPQPILALSLIVADTEEEANTLAGEYKIVKLHLESGRTLTVGTLEQAEEFGRQTNEKFTVEEKPAEIIRGTKDSVRRQLLEAKERYGVGEFVVTTAVRDFGKRLRSFELLREAFTEVAAQ